MGKLTAQGISKSFDNKPVIENIDISIKEGEIVCLLGVSGVGKSTLFHILSGLLIPDSGKVLLDGIDVTGKTGHISYMQQKDLLLPHKKIIDNIALPLVLKGVKKSEAREAAASRMAEFGLSGSEYKYPHQLSGGMRQRAALFRTYLFSSHIALLDEPFSALDAITKIKIHDWYMEMMDKIHLSTIFITHDVDEAILLSDRIYIMSGSPGSIVDEIMIDVPRPRDGRFTTSDFFMEYKRKVLDCLKI